MGPIVAVLPRGEAIRNFVYGGALDVVAQQLEVVALSVIPADDYRQLLTERYPKVIELREVPERRVLHSLRQFLDMAHCRWLWSEAARERWYLHDFAANTPGRRLRRAAKKILCYAFAHRAGAELLAGVERVASRWLRTTDEYVNLFRDLKPSLVFNGAHSHSRVATPAIQAAQWLGIPTATFVFSWDNLTSQGRMIPTYDYYLTWSEGMRAQLLDIYHSVRPEHVFVTGTPQFDFHFLPDYHWSREEFCARVGADPARPIVVYTTCMPFHTPGEPLIVERIADMLQEMKEFGPPQLLVRVYPKDETGRFEELKARRPDILFPEVAWDLAWLTPRPEDVPMLTNTLRHAAVGINVASTISLELCMFDKPIINVGYNPPGMDVSPKDYRLYYRFDHYRPVVESGAIALAESESQMRSMIVEALAQPQTARAERRALIQEMFGDTLDGRSGERVAERLLQLCHAREQERPQPQPARLRA